MKKTIYQSVTLTFILFVLFGGIYPVLVSLFGQILFSQKANGSMIIVNNNNVGSALIGQQFTQEKYFHGRPSAAGKGYDASNSGASQLAVTNEALYTNIQNSIDMVLKENPGVKVNDIPVDLVTKSGSGLDPDISSQSALLQVRRIALSRGLNENIVKGLVEKNIEKPFLGIIGEEKVNVLELNLALDNQTK